MVPARISVAAREAILQRLSRYRRSTAVPVSKILADVRKDFPALRDSDDELMSQIVLDATDHGYAVQFDHRDE